MSKLQEAVSKNKPLILFDLDGTITPPRESLEWSMVPVLRKLSRLADIGIVSGSPFSYIESQAALAWNSIASLPAASFTIMPCNGTQLFVWSTEHRQFIQEYGLDFRDYLASYNDESVYTVLIRRILELQLQFIDDNQGFNHVTGNFVSYRTATLNWSPIGRDATSVDREAFARLDEKKNIRARLCESLRGALDDLGLADVEFALGGVTSIDIYPKGWDKTHALKHFSARPIWFIGDKCDPGGNDHSLWSALASSGGSFSTSGPEETIRILEEEIIPVLEKNSASN